MALEDGHGTVTLPLRVDEGAPVAVTAGQPLALHLRNETGRPVRPRLMNGSGTNVLWLRLPEIAAGAEAQLPLVALKPGEYHVLDAPQDATVARLVAE